MPVFGFNESELFVWQDGTPQPTESVGWAQNIQLNPAYQYNNLQNINGNYVNLYTGRRIDVSFTLLHDDTLTLYTLAESQAGLSLEFRHMAEGRTTGIRMSEGRLTVLPQVGNAGEITQRTYQYHANIWTEYVS